MKVKAIEEINLLANGKLSISTVSVINKLGRTFSLNRRISQRKFPNVKEGDVITISFSGTNLSGTPKFPTIKEHCGNVLWKNVIPYWIEKPKFSQSHCVGCLKNLAMDELRVQVKVILPNQ